MRWREALAPHSGPVFIDFPLDQVFLPRTAGRRCRVRASASVPARMPARARARAALLRDAERPVIMAGTGLYWGRGEEALRELAEAAAVPVFLNGLGRGCLPADHELSFSRARSARSARPMWRCHRVPLDFRLASASSLTAPS